MRISLAVTLCGWLLGSWLVAGPLRADEDPTGQQLYEAQCARCHGMAGEGTAEHYDEPLIGDRSVLELAEVIAKTMPEDKAEKCTGEDARKVAVYIHDAFYSPVAQDRNRPARVELSRLTVRQYQNTLTDLIGSFRAQPAAWDEQRGLAGEYYKNRRFRREDRQIERVDPQVSFDFGEGSPDDAKFEKHEFSIRWEGAVFAPDSGDYEFIVRTEHATRLWVNARDGQDRQPLIDAWVKSGNDTEYRGSIRLLGGRSYPLKLEFSKAKQGVDDSNKDKDKPKPAVKASIALLWKRPQRPEEVIPARCLSPKEVPEVFVSSTPFPPDDRSIGYERGTAISKAWDEATTEGAIEVASYITANLRELTGVNSDAEDCGEQLKAWCGRFVERAFRRPLGDEERQLYVDRHFAEGVPPDLAVNRVVLLSLKSPRFLLREAIGEANDPYNVATRLSYALWDSMPDEALRKAASEAKLATREQIAQQAQRLLDDARSRAKLRAFLLQWLKAEQVLDLSKDKAKYPEFDEIAASDLRTSLELMIDDLLASESVDFRQLLLADSTYLNGRLAKLYGVDLPTDAPFQQVALEPDHRSGVLTHPYLLAGFAYASTSSPIHRGVFLSRSVLGRALRPPPEAVSPIPVEAHPDLTTRERIALQTKAEACNVCHAMINPLGFTLEHFDAIGRYRADENGRPIDASGSYLTRAGETVKFGGVRDLAGFLAASDETHVAFTEQFFHYLVKQPVRAYGPEILPQLKQSFVDNQFNLKKLAAEIVTRTAAGPPTN